jgi:excisionase family DNA binding protein
MVNINIKDGGHYYVHEYYTAKELADKLSLNVMTIYRYIDAGKLKAYKIGKEFRIEKAEFERFMNKAKIK